MDTTRLFAPLAGVDLSDLTVYVVGGAVRDSLLGRTPKDCDYVAVGTTASQLLTRGFQQVGADFPVFLHPISHAEVALARTERKTAKGHRGFVVHADPSVTLEADLKRRDFTINAMALSIDGQLIDPYGGQQDLTTGVLRHVSDAFREDPLRVLRGCRFLAQLGELGFQWAPETLAECKSMGRELTSLSSERVIQEMMKLLSATQPERGVRALHDTGALAELLPEIQHLPTQFQMEGAEDRLIEWALAHHPTTACLDSVIRRFRLPQTWHQQLMAAVTLQSTPHHADADTRLTVMQQLGWLRGSPPDGELDATLGRLDALAHFPITLSTWLKHRTKVRAIHVQDLAFEGLQGAALGNALRSARLRVLSTEISAPGTAPGL